jgi:hypothetical protein
LGGITEFRMGANHASVNRRNRLANGMLRDRWRGAATAEEIARLWTWQH